MVFSYPSPADARICPRRVGGVSRAGRLLWRPLRLAPAPRGATDTALAARS